MQEIPELVKEMIELPGGIRIETYRGGAESGQAVVLLHGGGTDHAMLSWRDLIPDLLAAGYRVYAPNFPGYGDSPSGRLPATLENLTGYLEGLFEAWKLPRATLMGISMGGGVAIGTALKHPEWVSRLVLIGTYGIQDRAPYHLASYLLLKLPWINDLSWEWMRRSRWAARYSLSSIVRNPKSLTDALFEETFAAAQNRAAQRAFSQFQLDEIRWSGVKTDYSSRLKEIEAPVLIIHGTQDLGVPLKYAQQAAKLLPHARLEVIPGAGHWTQRDEPERVNRLIVDFLGGKEEDSPRRR